MRAWLFVMIFVFSAVHADKSAELKKCLLECYRVDTRTADQIVEKFAPILLNHELVVDLFIEESKKLDIYSASPGQARENLPYHSVLFENENLRITWAVTKSGERELPQIHPWKSVMVVIQSSPFTSKTENGAIFEDHWPVGVYVLDPSFEQFTCTNVGPGDYKGLVFEIKTQSL